MEKSCLSFQVGEFKFAVNGPFVTITKFDSSKVVEKKHIKDVLAATGYQDGDQIASISESSHAGQLYMTVRRKKASGDTALIYKIDSGLALVPFADGASEPREVEWQNFV